MRTEYGSESLLDKLANVFKRKEKTMTKETKQNKKSFVTYAYGQIYRAYLDSGKQAKFTITNIHVREWKKILGWLKKNEYIVNFKLGDTIETACELQVEGFNEENLIYENYLKAIERNRLKEVA